MIGFRIQKNPLEKTKISRRTMKEECPEIEDPEMESEPVPDLTSDVPSMEKILSPFYHRLVLDVNVNEKVDHPGNKKIDHPRDKKSESFWGFSCLSVVTLLKSVRLPLEYQHMGMVSQSIQESGCQGGI